MKVLMVSDFLKTIHDVIQTSVATNISTIAHVISPVFFAAVGLYIVYIAYEIVATQRDTIMKDVVKNIILFSLIGAFTYSSPYYTDYVVPFVMDAGNDISAALLGGTDAATSVDNMWNGLIKALETYRTNAIKDLHWGDIGGYLVVILTYIVGVLGGVILIFFITVYLAVTMFMIGLLLSAGVIFICFAAFPSTRAMFTAWASNCLNYVLLNVFYAIAFSLVLDIISKRFSSIDSKSVSIIDAVFLLLVVLISVFIIEQIGTMTSSLTGGVGINGLTGSVKNLLRFSGKYLGKLAAGRGKAAGRPRAGRAGFGKNNIRAG